MAVVARFPDDEDPEMLQAYRQGCGVDAVGGAEAIISHLVTAGGYRGPNVLRASLKNIGLSFIHTHTRTTELKVPCAHAPGLPPLDVDAFISPKCVHLICIA